MSAMYQKEGAKKDLESIFNSRSIGDIISALAELCNERARNLEVSYKNESAARYWKSCARILGGLYL